ncbi:amidase signature enzyme [Pseudomassariella vexata]|uniref:Amidase signature enzyme n=1 Tax=Pseudomassariella vexata TaxID=1141098 RepID=A0A1Y2EH53_9PEZI|nr:amidase signature enzyme [Pseudomassariella vexata]ORY70901.1 amidase signature enzyme [Pseudomassariella vexata]
MSVVQPQDGITVVTGEDLRPLLSKAGLQLSEKLLEDYTTLLSGLEGAIASLPDDTSFLPKPDLSKYPRTDINIPSPEESDGGGWATRVTARCTSPKSDLLKGRTVALKDNMAFAGVRCTNGTSMVEWVPEIDATIATWIMDAGGIIIGKAACENSCLEGMSATSVTGPVQNPFADGYNAGGSSSGSGRLVATGSVDMAIGCDQGGSIRIPASECGIVGLKPTWGLVPYTGILSLDAHLDHAGPMTRNVRDCALLLEVIAGPDGWDDRQPPFGLEGDRLKYVEHVDAVVAKDGARMLEGVKVGVLKEGFDIPGINADVAQTVKAAVKKLESLGAAVSEVSVPQHKIAPTVWTGALPLAGGRQAILGDMDGRKQLHFTDRAAKLDAQLTQAQFDALGPGASNMYMGYLWVQEKHGAKLQGKCMNLIKSISDAYDKALQEFDVLVMPTLPTPPPRLPEPGALGTTEGPLKFLSRSIGMIANTCPFDNSGHPALSLPVGFVPAVEDAEVKLPTAMQIVGRKYQDVNCLKVAAAWEKAFDWKTL